MHVTEINTDIETIRDMASRLWAGDALGEIFTVRALGGNWTRLRGEHGDICAVVTQAKGYGIGVR